MERWKLLYSLSSFHGNKFNVHVVLYAKITHIAEPVRRDLVVFVVVEVALVVSGFNFKTNTGMLISITLE